MTAPFRHPSGQLVQMKRFVNLRPGDVLILPDGSRHPVESIQIHGSHGRFTTTTGITVEHHTWDALRNDDYEVAVLADQDGSHGGAR